MGRRSGEAPGVEVLDPFRVLGLLLRLSRRRDLARRGALPAPPFLAALATAFFFAAFFFTTFATGVVSARRAGCRRALGPPK